MTVFEVDWDAFAAREPDIAAIAVLGAPEPVILVQPHGSDYLAGPMLRARMMDYAGSLAELAGCSAAATASSSRTRGCGRWPRRRWRSWPGSTSAAPWPRR